MMKKMFGSKKKNPSDATTLPDAIIQMKQTEQLLLKKQDYLETKIQREVAYAKTNAKRNKKGALEALQRKKKLENQLKKLDGALTTLETQRDALENANTNSLVLSSMSDASNALKSAHKHMNADQVDELLDGLVDQKELSEEISNAISNPVGFNEDIDEDELEKELAELELDDFESDSTSEMLPTVPVDDITTTNPQTPLKKRLEDAKIKPLTS